MLYIIKDSIYALFMGYFAGFESYVYCFILKKLTFFNLYIYNCIQV